MQPSRGTSSMLHVFITGASSGLGASLARAYATRGAALTLIARDGARLDAVAASCRQLGAADVTAEICDVTAADAMQRLVCAADARRPIGIVIANAGIGGNGVLVGASGETVELARSIIEINTMGVIHTVAPLLPGLVARRRGHVVLIASVAAAQGVAEAPVYSASKAAVRVYGQALRRLLRPHGVQVCVVLPGFIDTPMSRSLPHRQPFALTADDAAQRIVVAIDRGTAEAVFPLPFRLLSLVIRVTPDRLVDAALAAASRWTRNAR